MYENYQIKIFESITVAGLEERVNAWLDENCRHVDAIKSISVSTSGSWCYATIVYLMVGDGPNA